MKLEKSQIISTIPTEPICKAIWLKWWNSNHVAYECLCFPLGYVIEKEPKTWLIKASFLFLYIFNCFNMFSVMLKDIILLMVKGGCLCENGKMYE